MPRIARIVVPGVAHHVTQRGNRQEPVFFSDEDRRVYLDLLATYCRRNSLSVISYCLMTNHVHLVVVPPSETSLGTVLKPVHLRYAQHINFTQGFSGRLWQGRYFSCALGERHLWAALRYVERNPVRAGMVVRAQDYPWSSAGARCGLRDDPLLSDPLGLVETVGAWAEWLACGEEEDVVRELRQNTLNGRPVGADDFLESIERELGRTVRRRSPGRPPRPGSVGKG